jgi:hypothetical protein
MARLYDMAQMTVTSTGITSPLTLGAAAVVGGVTYLSFATAGVLDQQTVSYRIVDGTQWEIGRGVYTATGTTLTRLVLFSSAGGTTAININSANPTCMISALAEDFNNTIALGLTASGQTLTAAFNEMTTVAAAAAVGLPTTMVAGDHCIIRNSGGNALTVNPPSGAAINNLAINSPMSVTPDNTAYFQMASTVRWYTVP